ncbi:MAG: hypothetical protein ACO3LZ_08835, partial [Candidatus Nanopelagicales bacterium]
RAVAGGQPGAAAPALSSTKTTQPKATPASKAKETPSGEQQGTTEPAPPPPISAVAPSSAPAPPAKPKKASAAAAAGTKESATTDSTHDESNDSSGEGLNVEAFVTMWPAVMDSLSQSRVAWMAFSGSRPLSWDNGVLAVSVDSQGKATNVAQNGHDEALRTAIRDVLKIDARIDVVFAPDGASAPAQPGPSRAKAAPTQEADAPSLDDANVDDVTGVELVMRELGATQIGEIEH